MKLFEISRPVFQQLFYHRLEAYNNIYRVSNIFVHICFPFLGAFTFVRWKFVYFQIGWSIITLTNYTPLIIIAIGITGFGAAGQAVSAVYIAEIVQDSIRGMLTSSCVTIYFTGLLFSYIIGVYNGKLIWLFKRIHTPYVCTLFHFLCCAIYLILIALLIELKTAWNLTLDMIRNLNYFFLAQLFQGPKVICIHILWYILAK